MVVRCAVYVFSVTSQSAYTAMASRTPNSSEHEQAGVDGRRGSETMYRKILVVGGRHLIRYLSSAETFFMGQRGVLFLNCPSHLLMLDSSRLESL